MFLIHLHNELSQKVLTEMLDGIKPNSLQRKLPAELEFPIKYVFLDLGVRIVETSKHQIILVTLLAVNIIAGSPAFCLVAKDLVDCGLVVVGIVIGAGEGVPVILLLRIFITASREIDAKLGIDLVRVGDGLVTIFLVNLLCFALLLVVCSGFVVEG
jgi:hypothetical protein